LDEPHHEESGNAERHHIEGRSAQMIADHLKATYEEFC
jgi:hypothetical protein